METFRVRLSRRDFTTINVAAESAKEAVRKAVSKSPYGFNVDAVVSLSDPKSIECEVVSHCERCSDPIFDNETYAHCGVDGTDLCWECFDKEKVEG